MEKLVKYLKIKMEPFQKYIEKFEEDKENLLKGRKFGQDSFYEYEYKSMEHINQSLTYWRSMVGLITTIITDIEENKIDEIIEKENRLKEVKEESEEDTLKWIESFKDTEPEFYKSLTLLEKLFK